MSDKVAFTAEQKKIFYSNKQWLGFISGTGAGKTWLASYWIIEQASNAEHDDVLLAMSKDLKHLKRNLWRYMKNVFRDLGIEYTENRTEMRFDLDFGGRHVQIFGGGANEPDSIQGIHPVAIACDEPGLYSMDAFLTISQRAAFHKAQVLLAGTPYRWNWIKTEIYDKAKAGDNTIEIVQVSSLSNPYYPREQYYENKKRMPAWRFGMLFDGLFTKPSGLIYSQYKTCAPFEIPDHWPIMAGMDFGFNDPMAVIWVAKDPATGVQYAFKTYKETERIIDDVQIELEALPCLVYADAANKGHIETLKRRGLTVRSANKEPGSVAAGIALLDGMFRSEELVVFDNLEELKQELGLYAWKLDKNDNPLDEPVKDHDHLLDALRYLMYSTQSHVITSGASHLRNTRKSYGISRAHASYGEY